MTIKEIVVALENLKDYINDTKKHEIDHIQRAVMLLREPEPEKIPEPEISAPTPPAKPDPKWDTLTAPKKTVTKKAPTKGKKK